MNVTPFSVGWNVREVPKADMPASFVDLGMSTLSGLFYTLRILSRFDQQPITKRRKFVARTLLGSRGPLGAGVKGMPKVWALLQFICQRFRNARPFSISN
jgi:hypothetical protein